MNAITRSTDLRDNRTHPTPTRAKPRARAPEIRAFKHRGTRSTFRYRDHAVVVDSAGLPEGEAVVHLDGKYVGRVRREMRKTYTVWLVVGEASAHPYPSRTKAACVVVDGALEPAVQEAEPMPLVQAIADPSRLEAFQVQARKLPSWTPTMDGALTILVSELRRQQG